MSTPRLSDHKRKRSTSNDSTLYDERPAKFAREVSDKKDEKLESGQETIVIDSDNESEYESGIEFPFQSKKSSQGNTQHFSKQDKDLSHQNQLLIKTMKRRSDSLEKFANAFKNFSDRHGSIDQITDTVLTSQQSQEIRKARNILENNLSLLLLIFSQFEFINKYIKNETGIQQLSIFTYDLMSDISLFDNCTISLQILTQHYDLVKLKRAHASEAKSENSTLSSHYDQTTNNLSIVQSHSSASQSTQTKSHSQGLFAQSKPISQEEIEKFDGEKWLQSVLK